MKTFLPAALFLVTALSSAATQATGASPHTLDGPALLARVVGNTIHYHAPDEDIFEFLAADGRIHGESTVHGKYGARWRLYEGDAICFEHDDPMASGCVAVVLRASMVEYHRRDGVVEGPFEMLPGNPRNL
jgi:hypothetical protein